MAEAKRKWLPLESDPAVFTEFATKLGCSGLEFCDVFGLDVDLLAMVPRPVVAVILLFPIEGETGELANQEAHKEAGGQGSGSVFYVKQKIGNACGTIALLHAMANNRDLATFQDGSFISTFVRDCEALSPDQRADYLDKKAEEGLESAHNAAAAADQEGGEGAKPITEEEMNTDLHFVCYVESEGGLWELDGRSRLGATRVGDCTKETLLEGAADAIKKRMASSASIRFNLMACTLSQD